MVGQHALEQSPQIGARRLIAAVLKRRSGKSRPFGTDMAAGHGPAQEEAGAASAMIGAATAVG